MSRPSRYAPEVRERAVRLVLDHTPEYASQWTAIASIATTTLALCAEEMRQLHLCRSIRSLAALAALTACSGDSAGPPVAPVPVPTAVKVSPAIDTLDAVGETMQLSALVLDQNGDVMASEAVSWSTSDASVLDVNGSSGRVTARAQGTAVVTAQSRAALGIATITVRPPARVLIVSASQQRTDISEWTVSVTLRNAGGRGFYYIEFWSLRTSPVGPDHLLGVTQAVEVSPTYEESVSYRVPTPSTLGVSWLLVYTRDPDSGAYRQSARFDF